jgi:hypothetical protein
VKVQHICRKGIGSFTKYLLSSKYSSNPTKKQMVNIRLNPCVVQAEFASVNELFDDVAISCCVTAGFSESETGPYFCKPNKQAGFSRLFVFFI